LGEYIKAHAGKGAKKRVDCSKRQDPPMPASQEVLRIKGQVKTETTVLVWSTPGGYCGDDTIANIAANQLSNYIYQTIVPNWQYGNEDQAVDGVGCFYNPSEYAGSVYCFIEPAEGYKGTRLADKAADALYRQWDREVYKNEAYRRFIDWSFQQAKINGMTSILNSVDEVAQLYGRATTTAMDAHFTGDVRYFSRMMNQINSVGGIFPVQEYARKWLTRDRMVTIIVEPMGRGTAPCVGLAAVRLARIDPRGVMIVLPADHAIADGERFLKLLNEAVNVASAGTHLVTLGINPDRPATGYGYIKAFTPYSTGGGSEVLAVERFTEKPDRQTAEEFLQQGGYYWNSGMFIWRVDTILREMEAHMPKLYSGLMKIMEHADAPDYEEALGSIYAQQEANSIDYGVLEKSEHVLVIPTGNIGWSDVGDWSALSEVLETDGEGNLIRALHIGIDTSNCTILSEDESGGGRLIATLGLSNLVIVDTDDVLLVMDKSRSQEVKEVLRIHRDRQRRER
jgi:mannose-1-phosphate guanylyltransferase